MYEIVKSEMFCGNQCDFYENDSNEVFMTALQLGSCLEYSDPIIAINKIVSRNEYLKDTEFSVVTKLVSTDGKQYNTRLFTEDGIYEVTMLSKTDKARQFRAFVREAVKSIRKTGSYSVNQTDSYMISDPIKRAERWIEEEKVRQALALKVESQSKEIKIMQPKADYFDDLVDRNLLTGFRETAKELKVGERNFIKFLLDNKFVFRDGNKKLMPYANKNDGLFEVKEVKNSKSSWSGVRTMITPKGRETFRLLMKRSKT